MIGSGSSAAQVCSGREPRGGLIQQALHTRLLVAIIDG
jgi:hypothetical protein